MAYISTKQGGTCILQSCERYKNIFNRNCLFPVLQQPRSECNIKFLMANIQVYISYQTDEIETLELLQDIRSDLKKTR